MSEPIIRIIAETVGVSASSVKNTVILLEEGCTVPFIARYRKERTGSLDEVAIGRIKDQHTRLLELEKRKQTILSTISEQDALTEELKNRIENCYDSAELEDIYLPFKPKRRTRATIAREMGLEPLAKKIMSQYEKNPEQRATSFLNDKVPNTEAALAGARDIIAEWVSENEKTRSIVRQEFRRNASIASKVIKGKEEEGAKYRD